MFRGSFEHALGCCDPDEKERSSISSTFHEISMGMRDVQENQQGLIDQVGQVGQVGQIDKQNQFDKLNTTPRFDPNFLNLPTLHLPSAHQYTRIDGGCTPNHPAPFAIKFGCV